MGNPITREVDNEWRLRFESRSRFDADLTLSLNRIDPYSALNFLRGEDCMDDSHNLSSTLDKTTIDAILLASGRMFGSQARFNRAQASGSS
jgi:hypothetical protein